VGEVKKVRELRLHQIGIRMMSSQDWITRSRTDISVETATRLFPPLRSSASRWGTAVDLLRGMLALFTSQRQQEL
jgi:hypothetical protein